MNKNDRVLVGGSWLFFWILYLIVSIGWVFLTLKVFGSGNQNELKRVFLIISLIMPFVAMFLMTLFCNRACNIVTKNGNKIVRKGLLFGFRCYINIDEIIAVKKVFLNRDDAFYVIDDGKHETKKRLKKNSSIFINCDDKGKNFIKSFYNKDIPEAYY